MFFHKLLTCQNSTSDKKKMDRNLTLILKKFSNQSLHNVKKVVRTFGIELIIAKKQNLRHTHFQIHVNTHQNQAFGDLSPLTCALHVFRPTRLLLFLLQNKSQRTHICLGRSYFVHSAMWSFNWIWNSCPDSDLRKNWLSILAFQF